MKRCPECRRDYYDGSLLFCLDDGASLLEGSADGDDKTRIFGSGSDEPLTAILPGVSTDQTSWYISH